MKTQVAAILAKLGLRDRTHVVVFAYESGYRAPRLAQRGMSDVRLSTLEPYVEALGGKLEIHAVFDDADIRLTA